MTRRSWALVAFWYAFIVGDDWRIAIGVVTALVLTYGLSNSVTAPTWWVLPATVLMLLPLSLWRVAHRRHRAVVGDSLFARLRAKTHLV